MEQPKLCKCGKPKDRPGQAYCRSCHAAYQRAHRKPLTEEDRVKDRARSYAGVYLRKGALKREPCVECGAPAEMHHPDYAKPLEVVWMCRPHHLLFHAKQGHGTVL